MISILVKFLIFSNAIEAHMALSNPAPRRSVFHSGYSGSNKDYDLTSPLGRRFTFPCRGAPVGPVYKSYSAGSDIDIHIAGSAKHNGGHCQFSMTYDQINFAVLKTVMGDCIIKSVDYKVTIPKDAPNGNATFAWTWFNKVGNREMYMNCVDIEITDGKENGSITGKKLVIANLPGYPTFPEGFSDTFGKDLYESQPTISVKPKRSPTRPTNANPNPKPTLKPSPPTSSCVQGTHVCKGLNSIGICWNYSYSYRPCSKGTHCTTQYGDAVCR